MKQKIKNNIFLLYFLILLSGCYSIKSRYSYENKKDSSICFISDIYDYKSQVFVRKLQESFTFNDFNNCKYFVITELLTNFIDLSTIGGITMQRVVNLSVLYNIFIYDKDKHLQLIDILQNPMIRKFEYKTGTKESRMSRGTHSEAVDLNREENGKIEVFNDKVFRISQNFKKISGGSYNNVLSYFTNPILITTEVQSEEDTNKQLAESLAERVEKSIILDIETYENKQKQALTLKEKKKNNNAKIKDDKIKNNIKNKNEKSNKKAKLK